MMEGKNTEQEQQYPQGIKWTKQRKCVYQVLSEAREPLSAQQIYLLSGEKAGQDRKSVV